MAVNISPVLNEAQFRDDGALAVGYKIYTYAQGSSTPQATYTSASGAVAQSNPIVLNARGEADNQIYLTEGVAYRLVLTTAADVVVKTFDNIVGSIGASSNVVDQWITLAVTPTYINATQFSVPGDRTADFQVNRRVKLNVSAGTRYGYVTASAFTTLTTVTVRLDSGSLDIGLNGSSIQVGLLTPQNPSYPQNLVQIGRINDLSGYSGADILLAVGETAIYNTGLISTLPLRIATGANQIYDLTVSERGAFATHDGAAAIRINNVDYAGVVTLQRSFAIGSALTTDESTVGSFIFGFGGFHDTMEATILTGESSGTYKYMSVKPHKEAGTTNNRNILMANSLASNAVAWTSLGTFVGGRTSTYFIRVTRRA